MRDIKFEYVGRNLKFNEIVREAYTLDEIVNRLHIATFFDPSNTNCELLARREFTGLKDMNGKEIFEGDILDDGGVIEFRDDLNWDSGGSVHSGFFSTKGYEYQEDGCLSYHYQIGEHEVIGNIYENEELLNV